MFLSGLLDFGLTARAWGLIPQRYYDQILVSNPTEAWNSTKGPPGKSYRNFSLDSYYILYSSPLIIFLTFLSFYYIPDIHLVIFHDWNDRFCSGRHGEIEVKQENREDKIICKQEILQQMSRDHAMTRREEEILMNILKFHTERFNTRIDWPAVLRCQPSRIKEETSLLL